jgi:acetyl/propionyl-CoA carboxylase alpha subunit
MAEAEADPERLAAFAEELGYPVLVKAVLGGGGKGMRLARSREELAEAARRGALEARAAFGDGAIYLEKALERPRHVEIQILGDSLGRVIHLNERECSLQRRHQKILEECPSPALDPGLRREMGEAAVALALRAGYQGAGTVEFLLEEDRRFYFLEVNARLQVEHPVTEMTTGLDLVRCQIEIAAGLPLALRPEDLAPRGHAIECRIYAEDPASGFLPSPGRVELLREPRGPGIRFDGGVVSGSAVPFQYDPLLGKVVAHGPTREAAIARMVRALEELCVEGVPTPRELLLDVLRSEAFRAGRTDTRFLEERFGSWRPASRPGPEAALPARPRPAPGAGPPSPWQSLGAWDLAGGGEPAAPPRPPAAPAGARRSRPRAAPAAAAPSAPGPGLPPGAVTPPMPAAVVAVLVQVGQEVAKGQPAVVVSAMKMEIQLGAPCAGRVRSVAAAPGARVRPGDLLVEVEPGGGAHGG